MAAMFGAAALWAASRPVLAAACWLACCAMPLSVIDAITRRLPNPLTAAAFAGTAVFLLLAAVTGGQWHDLGRAMAGGGILAGGYGALAVAGAAGPGDAKLAASIGALLGWAGWWPLLAGTAAAFLLAAPYSAAMLVSRLRPADSRPPRRMPFGPFMITGAFLTLALMGTTTR
jgi:leader peptidase (prepilin peptidase)/N-methyltransferase